MSNELVKASPVSVPATGKAASLPELVERAGAGGPLPLAPRRARLAGAGKVCFGRQR